MLSKLKRLHSLLRRKPRTQSDHASQQLRLLAHMHTVQSSNKLQWITQVEQLHLLAHVHNVQSSHSLKLRAATNLGLITGFEQLRLCWHIDLLQCTIATVNTICAVAAAMKKFAAAVVAAARTFAAAVPSGDKSASAVAAARIFAVAVTSGERSASAVAAARMFAAAAAAGAGTLCLAQSGALLRLLVALQLLPMLLSLLPSQEAVSPY